MPRWVFAPFLVAVAVIAAATIVRELDRAFPPPLDRPMLSVQVVDRNGELLRAFATPAGYWRLPADLDAIDQRFLRMLVVYEDRRFFTHRGIDPLALVRAAGQLVRHGRIISGGSTITMQLARLLDGRGERSLAGKVAQMLRALQIEARLTKRQILSLYLTLAPYGGNLEGVTAASWAWLGKPPRRLSPGEAALLVALPQLPERRRPDRYPQAARKARDRVIERMIEAGVVDHAEARMARHEPLGAVRRGLPAHAAHLAQGTLRLAPDGEVEAAIPAVEVHRTTIDLAAQKALETLVRERVGWLGDRLSVAMIAADHRTGEVVAHVGSPDFFDARRWGEIDITRARRSPGSTLKPFIYGIALEEGLVAPETLIDDRPADFAGYRPANFDLTYQGTVTVRQALQLSLNVPAIMLLDAVGPHRLVARLAAAGIRLEMPAGRPAGLAVGLGGVGVTLSDLVALYGGLANGGRMIDLVDGLDRRRPRQGEARLLDSRASLQIADILLGTPPPDQARPGIAYKTGTSYGYRDAWAVGFDGRHVIGVWVGRPDGGAIAGLTGRSAAAPLLFEAFERLPGRRVALSRRLPGSLRLATADLPSALKRFSPAHRRLPAIGRSIPLSIVHPPDGARIEIGPPTGQNAAPLVVKLQGGKAPFRWLANGRPVIGRERRRTFDWLPDGPGAASLTVIDAAGQAASLTVYLDQSHHATAAKPGQLAPAP